MLHIFHHIDADGYAAGFLVKKYYTKRKLFKEKDIDCYPINYGMTFPFEKINKNDIVYIVDFSIEPSEMVQLFSKTKNVIWIDHHISAKKMYEEWGNVLKVAKVAVDGIRDITYSGSTLTWIWFYLLDNDLLNQEAISDSNTYEKLGTYIKSAIEYEMPLWLKLINDWDIWQLKIDITKPFIAGLNTMLSMETMNELNKCAYKSNFSTRFRIEPYKLSEYKKSKKIKELVNKGNQYIEFRNNYSEGLKDKYGYVTNIYDQENNKYLDIYCLNVGMANSEYIGQENLDKYDLVSVYCFNGSKYKYSLYSNKDYVDCSKLARQFGIDNGGGHKGAAGFMRSELVFRKIV